tara:strand:+ start:1479 stop:4379 length:2901 start_codon:yes stop_codon:yes gene_type:complete
MTALTKNRLTISIALFLFIGVQTVYGTIQKKYITNEASNENFPIASKGHVASIYVSDSDFKGVLHVVNHLQNDIFNVTSLKPNVIKNNPTSDDFVIIIGTLGKSSIISKLVLEGKIDATQLQGKWEKFMTQVIDNPFGGTKKALVIAGSDKRGTIYGIYDLSKQMGVSPLYFWADVPIKKQTELHVLPGIHTLGEPKVKYRGIFINDEAPALTGWVYEKYGDFNADFYDKVFELILRLKGNYLWPAMWSPRKFNVDDPQNAILADEYGIVMGTSHHEPLSRAHAEWNSKVNGKWDFNSNAEGLKEFWKGGIERMGNKETLVTIGMRGDGDEAMSEETATDLLETIVKEQRKIIAEVTGKPADQTPQMWALYKEVQDYYDKGMQVPDDVTLLLCDDNWGNIRKLPSLEAKPRKGGYGIYYHFDYVGGPRNYKWINTNQIERTWEQMHLAYKHGVDRIWIVNVGDIKPMEFPLSFFLDYAWNSEQWDADNLQNYYTEFADYTFDGQFTNEIANLLKGYTKYNANRTPELLDEHTYNLINYNEAETHAQKYNELAKQAEDISEKLKPEYRDAFYHLVMHPVTASANLNELYLNVAKNKLYAEQGRALTNSYAEKATQNFEKDAQITKYFHTSLAGGKWSHMMSQVHIGYKIWQEPKQNTMPETKTISLPKNAEVGVAIEGSTNWWPNASEEAVLPTFTSYNDNQYYVDIFNRGIEPFTYKIKSKSKWLSFSKTEGTINQKERISVKINWEKAPKGFNKTMFTIVANNKKLPVYVQTNNADLKGVKGFIETDGFIAIDAANFSDKTEPENFTWNIVENLGKTGDAVISLPIEKGRIALTKNSSKLSYNVNFQTKGKVKVHLYFAPTINYATREGMYFGLSFDNENPVQINYDADPNIFNYNGKVPEHWHDNVSDHIKIITTEMDINEAGNHTLNYYRVDEGLVLQKIVIETKNSNLKETYLGPSQSFKTN